MLKLTIKNFNTILTEKQQKISASSLHKTAEYDYLTHEDILPSYQRQIIEKAKCAYSSLQKTFEKQIKTIEDQIRNQINAITNQNERPTALTNKDDYKDNYK